MSAHSHPILVQDSKPPVLLSLSDLQRLRVAVVHEWLTAFAGSEKVLEQILEMFPAADVLSLVDHLPAHQRHFLGGRSIRTSFLQKLPWSSRLFRKFLWLMPAAIESLDVSRYDIVISSSHAVAKGVITGPDQVHICYCHTPMRYAWDLQHEYLNQARLHRGILSVYARLVLHYIRLWDLRTANGVDKFIANSQFIARRIRKVYKRDALVVHPPVDVQAFLLERDKEDYYITASRLVPYKKVELIVSAFAQMPNRKLIVVGEGPGLHQCRSLATKNISFLGHQAPDKLIRLLCKAKAFVFAAEEDFGITLVEAQACGTPVIAYGKGGALDSVVPDKTGIFFHAQTPQSIVSAVERFASGAVTLLPAADIRRHSLQFDKAEFRSKMTKIIAEAWLGLLRDMREGAYFPGDQDSHRDAAVAFRAVAQ